MSERDQRFRELIGLLPAAVYVCDSAGYITDYNPRAVELWGRKPNIGDLAERYCGSLCLYHTDRRKMPHDQTPMAEVLRTGIPAKNKELLIERPDGSFITVLVNIAPLHNEHGELVGAINCFQDITERKQAQDALAVRVQQQAMVAELGQLALAGADLQQLFDRAVTMVATTFGVEFCKILELLPDKRAMKLVAGLGWRDGVVGHATVPAGHDSPAGFTLLAKEPLIIEDLRAETRFNVPALLRGHDVASGITVVIGSLEKPFGVMGAHTACQRTFSQDDVNFFQSVANVLAEAIERKRAEDAITSLSHRLLKAQEVERRTLARELHDEIGQALTGLRLSLETSAVLPFAEKQGFVATINELVNRMRAMSLDLRPTMLDDVGLLPTLLWHLDKFSQQTHVAVDFQHSGIDRRFSPDLEIGVFRIIQEALTNVARHAQTDRVSVRVRASSSNLLIQIQDRGVGFDTGAVAGSYETSGITGMHERAIGLGGNLSIEAAPGKGTRVYVELPLTG